MSALPVVSPGVQINSNNSGLGGSVSVLLRGATSITGNNQPLFVVDGTPIANSNFNSSGTANASSGRDFGNAIQDINPDDIANISILKGGAAAALYGARAANGVVLITTKSGKNRNGLGVTINSGVTMQNVAVLPSYQNQYGGGYNLDFQTFEFDPAAHPAEWEAFDGQLTPNYNADESWGPRLDGTPVRHWDSWYPGETLVNYAPGRLTRIMCETSTKPVPPTPTTLPSLVAMKNLTSDFRTPTLIRVVCIRAHS